MDLDHENFAVRIPGLQQDLVAICQYSGLVTFQPSKDQPTRRAVHVHWALLSHICNIDLLETGDLLGIVSWQTWILRRSHVRAGSLATFSELHTDMEVLQPTNTSGLDLKSHPPSCS